jgi:hypothetical protein
VIFLAEFLLTRNFVLRVEEDSELLLEFTNAKLTREHVYFIHFRDGFIGTSFASFIFFCLLLSNSSGRISLFSL